MSSRPRTSRRGYWASYREYSLDPDLKIEEIISRELDLPKRRRTEKILKIARSTAYWSDELAQKVIAIVGQKAVRTKWTERITPEGRRQICKKLHGSYALWLLELADRIGCIGKMVDMPQRISYDIKESWLDLGYDRDADQSTIDSNNSYRLGEHWLTSQITVPLNHKLRELGPTTERLFLMGRACRRENPDSTHLRSFTQLQMRHNIENPTSTSLKEIMEKVLVLAGLDREKIVFRPTSNTFTAPSLEIYYETNGRLVEIGNGGLFLPQLYLEQNIPLPPQTRPIGFAMGLERIYMIATGIESIKEV